VDIDPRQMYKTDASGCSVNQCRHSTLSSSAACWTLSRRGWSPPENRKFSYTKGPIVSILGTCPVWNHNPKWLLVDIVHSKIQASCYAIVHIILGLKNLQFVTPPTIEGKGQIQLVESYSHTITLWPLDPLYVRMATKVPLQYADKKSCMIFFERIGWKHVGWDSQKNSSMEINILWANRREISIRQKLTSNQSNLLQIGHFLIGKKWS
jgi:hypothetical protein